MLDAGPDGFTGGMNARKYISITKASKATATRDLQYLSEQGVLITKGGGRSTHYVLNIWKSNSFINGILDKILIELKAENKIKKIGRGLIE